MFNGILLRTSRKRAKELKKNGFSCCICSDGLACAGAGKITITKKVLRLRCGNRTQLIGTQQKPAEVTLEEAQMCSRKSEHTKAPSG